MERFPEGTEIQVCGLFPNGDPDSEVAISIRRPDGHTTPLDVDRLAAGWFAAIVTLNAPGRWGVRIAATGAATESEFYVEKSVL